jgi:DNA-binding response OmpR family regulator
MGCGDHASLLPTAPQDPILTVEDDAEMAAVLQEGFEQEKFQVHLALDGEDGLHAAREHRYRAILLDVMLPTRDGFSVARELRKAGVSTPILMLTARDTVTDIVHGLDCGVDDYLTKPFSFIELAARVRALIRRTAPQAGRLQAGDLVMDTQDHEVYRAEQRIHLSPTEFQILEILLRRKGSVVRRSDLLHDVWGPGIIVEENTLDVTMSSLRARLELPGYPRLIHTVRGFGYRLKAAE